MRIYMEMRRHFHISIFESMFLNAALLSYFRASKINVQWSPIFILIYIQKCQIHYL